MGVEKREHFYTIGGGVCWHSHSGEQYGGSLKKKKKLKIELQYDPAILLLCIYLEKTITQKDTYQIRSDQSLSCVRLFATP